MNEPNETILNECDGFCYIRVYKDDKARALAFTTNLEDAERITNALLENGVRAVIEEYSDSDLIVHLERRGNKY